MANGPTVYLATVPPDIAGARAKLRDTFESYGVTVLPDATHNGSGSPFRSTTVDDLYNEIEAHLSAAAIAVHLLGTQYGEAIEDTSLAEVEFEASQAWFQPGGQEGMPTVQHPVVAWIAQERKAASGDSANDPGAAPAPQLQSSVFLSYNHGDAEEAERLRVTLEAAGIHVHYDQEAMTAGEDIQDFIVRSIRDTEATVFLTSNNSLASPWVAVESITTLYAGALEERSFFPCYIHDDFFADDYALNAVEQFDEEIEKIERLIERHHEKDLDARHLNEKLSRMRKHRNNFSDVLATLTGSLSLDVRGDVKLELAVARIAKALEQKEPAAAPAPRAANDGVEPRQKDFRTRVERTRNRAVESFGLDLQEIIDHCLKALDLDTPEIVADSQAEPHTVLVSYLDTVRDSKHVEGILTCLSAEHIMADQWSPPVGEGLPSYVNAYDGLLIVYLESPEEWVSEQVMAARELQLRREKLTAGVYDGPGDNPPLRSKPATIPLLPAKSEEFRCEVLEPFVKMVRDT